VRVLVSGATGFLGRHALPALRARGFEVHSIGRTPAPGATHHPADLLDPVAVGQAVRAARATHLLHLAWDVAPGYWHAPGNLDWVAASLHLARCFAASGGRRLVGAGTCAEYEWGAQRFDEAVTPSRPATLYGAGKDGVRRLLLAAAAPLGLSVAWGRIFYLYGPGEGSGRLVGGALAALSRGEGFDTSHGRQRRDFLHVADAGAAFAALLAGAVTGVVNVAAGEAVPVRRVLDTLAAALGGTGQIRFGARPLAAGEPAVIEAAITRLRDEVGFAPRFGLDAGLQDTVRCFRIAAVTGPG